AVSDGAAAHISKSWSTATTAPAMTQPTVNNLGDVITVRPVVVTSAYVTSPVGYDRHTHSRCLIRKKNSSVALWDSGGVDATTEFAVDIELPGGEDVEVLVRYRGSKLGWGGWSEPVVTATQESGGLGHIYPDGGIGGPVFGGYQLIVAPGSKRGQNIRHGLFGTDTSLTEVLTGPAPDPVSGFENTNILLGYSGIDDGKGSVGPAAAQYCRNLGRDWYLPSKSELIAIVSVADKIDAADSSNGPKFADIGNRNIWTSTEMYSTFSWAVKGLGPEYVGAHYRDAQMFVVPVRRVRV
ncbi:MAG: hypothetical protein OIF57_15505, partial [Marinobacterium sp.]|nr:hypothetical protein [Marinobacterium sp.]